MSTIVPAILPVSRRDFEEKLALVSKIPNVHRVQIDVVDGTFAAPASWPYTAPSVFRSMVEHRQMLSHLDRLEYEIDLMCLDVAQAIEAWLTLGASRLTLHAESISDLPRLLTHIRKRHGVDVVTLGLASNIGSDLALIEPYISQVSYVQFMGIARIGRQGQPFDERVYEKIRVFHARHPEVAIQVDGGVSSVNLKELITLGVSSVVVGSAILRALDPATEVAKLDAIIHSPYGV